MHDSDKRSFFSFKKVSLFQKTVCVVVCCMSLMIFNGHTSALMVEPDSLKNLKRMTIEDLMSIEVTTVSKKTQTISNATAAVFVITQNDIRRSGATTIPDLLRMVTGLQVGRIDANKWAITSRGFNGRFANKLLVLIDGRSVYDPLYSGVFWDVQDTLLEDVKHIEIIRGPGATMWGANAVNGVINIITQDSGDTQGGLFIASAGSEEKGFGALRYGMKLDNDTSMRIYGKSFERDRAVYASGEDADDEWKSMRGGFRLDRRFLDDGPFTLQGDIYKGRNNENTRISSLVASSSDTFLSAQDNRGGNILFRYEKKISNASNLFQIYYDRLELVSPYLAEKRDTIDVDFHQHFLFGDRHEVIWGLGYRFTHDQLTNSPVASFSPDSSEDNLFSAFFQDEIALIKDKMYISIGSKFEHNCFSGFEAQPNLRLLWIPHERHSLWMAISRAVRTPSRAEHDLHPLNQKLLPPGSLDPNVPLSTLLSLFGNKDFRSEELLAFEIGYRASLSRRLSLDTTAFYNIYDNLRSIEVGIPYPALPYMVLPSFGCNKIKGETYGSEITLDLRLLDWWRIQTSYTYLTMQLSTQEGSNDTFSVDFEEGQIPHHQFSLRNSLDLPDNLEWDMWFRYVDTLPDQNVGSYWTLDVRLGWKPLPALELSVVGQNLLDSHHPEYRPEFLDIVTTEVQRSVYGKIKWQF